MRGSRQNSGIPASYADLWLAARPAAAHMLQVDWPDGLLGASPGTSQGLD